MTTYNMELFTTERMDKLEDIIKNMLKDTYDRREIFFGPTKQLFSKEFVNIIENYPMSDMPINEREDNALLFLDACLKEVQYLTDTYSPKYVYYNGTVLDQQKLCSHISIQLLDIVDHFSIHFEKSITTKNIKRLYKSLKRIYKALEESHSDHFNTFLILSYDRFDIDKTHVEYFIKNRFIIEELFENYIKLVKAEINEEYRSKIDLTIGDNNFSDVKVLRYGSNSMKLFQESLFHLEKISIITKQANENIRSRLRQVIISTEKQYQLTLSYGYAFDTVLARMATHCRDMSKEIAKINEILFDVKKEKPEKKEESQNTDSPKGNSTDFLKEYITNNLSLKGRQRESEQKKLENQLSLGNGYDIDGHKFYVWNYKKENTFVINSHSLAPDFSLQLDKETAIELREKLDMYIQEEDRNE